ncbi:hypothetical protein PVK06_043724 [Gossypium arboreum]|uniref:Putative plant transposon protein domain-containing protein n=1 Tax=Gossypium arboreum TaxID=29729 RepID=A0ABR0MP85_GOSAR|nr:hypothetical protein PVK06_043724 [Gossypium arboreum]
MARTRGLLPWDANTINELYNLTVDVDEHSDFFVEVTDEKKDLLVQDLCIERARWKRSHPKNFTMHHHFLTLHSKIWFHFVNCKLLPSTHNTTVNLDRMCLIHSIIKSRKFDVGAILHREIVECAAQQTCILVFPSLVMSLCQQTRIVPQEDEEIMENKGAINEASVERMTRGTETQIQKEAGTSKTKKGKAKVDNKGTTLDIETSLWCKMKDVEKMVTSTSNGQIKLVATIEDIENS